LYKLQTAYLNWLEEYKPVLIQNEHTVWYWDYAMEIGFGGTLDRVWRMNWEGKEIIVVEDHKCSSQISESNWRQGEAYLRSYLQREQEKSHTETGGFYKPPDAIAILRLDKKAEKPTFEFKVKTNPQEREYYWQSYLGLLKYWWHNEELKKYRKELKKLEKGVAK